MRMRDKTAIEYSYTGIYGLPYIGQKKDIDDKKGI